MGILFFIIFIIVLFFLKNKSKVVLKNKKDDLATKLGKMGEARVALVLERLSSKYYVFNNVYLAINGKTVQIDHIILSIYGIFVIETKNYSGWIYGYDNSEYWIENKFGKKYQFYNPLKQNYSHIKFLKKLLDVYEDKFISIVLFSGEAELKCKTTGIVIYLDDLEDVIYSYTKPIFSEIMIEKIKQKLLNSIILDEKIEEFHIKKVRRNLEEKNKMIDKGICPKCGGKLVKRTSNFGNFIGCDNYPKCKFILKNSRKMY